LTLPTITQLDNGLRLLCHPDPHLQTATIGCFIKCGSRHEKPQEAGLSHFLEHAVFKGTGQYGPRQLAEAFDYFGCQTDAYTTKEETSFSIKVLAQHLPQCLDLWLAMIAQPTLDPEEMERERSVILEEIKMEEDNPEDRLQERCYAHFWPDHPLGKPILGLPEQIKGVRTEQIKAFHKRHYQPQNMFVVAIGAVDQALLAERLTHFFPQTSPLPALVSSPPSAHSFVEALQEDHLEQVNFNLTFPGLAESDLNRWALRLLNIMLGCGMSSRLFQVIREERGLAYSVGSYYASYSDSGQVSLYGGCSPQNLEQVIQLCRQELQTLCETGPDAQELIRAKNQAISALTMSQESSYARMQAQASAFIAFERPFLLPEILDAIQAIQTKDIQSLAQQIFQASAVGYGAIGPVTTSQWSAFCDPSSSIAV
jgi:predicted Zn-dependent peptidase